jgi:N-acetylglucosaminyl-diphospho-decaprenol L-rhamnosyltransferase
MLPSVDIIIVNWNSSNQLHECLDSVADSDRHKFRLEKVIIVDNASTDRSLDCLSEIDLPVDMIKNLENKGFGVACNQGAAISKADYILFLNPDARLFKEAIDKAVSFIQQPSSDRVGVVGIQLIDSQGNIQRNCARFPTPINFLCSILGIDKVIGNKFTSYMMAEWSHETTQPVDHVMGAFYLIGSKLFQSVGGFDENFFVYFEDLDLSYRLYKQGFSSYYLADVQSFHKGGGTSDSVKSTRIFYSIRSRILYAYKHFNWFQATTILLASLSIEPFTRVIFSIIKLSRSQLKETIFAYIQLFADYKNICRLIAPQSPK